MILTAIEAWTLGLAPADVYDANGVRVRRMITAVDAETGYVESFILNRDGQQEPTRRGWFRRRIERYPAPLLVKQAERPAEDYWDKEGR